MQDKKAVPGTSDFTVHDECGRPLFRVDVPSHGSLTAWLRPIARFVRGALGKTVKPLLVFDRGGAFPNEMAALRDEDFEFLTYERAPYPTLSVATFDRTLELTLASKPTRPIRISFTEAPDKNLRRQRGRVRRISLRMPDGNQINILTCSSLPAEELIPIQLLRWGRQENQFKHEVERWGLNQLDGRKVELYPVGTIVPNPARRKLEQSLHLARAAEGQLRRKLARLGSDEAKRAQLEQDLENNLALQQDLEDIRPHVPTHAPVEETELANKLVYHDGNYKTVIDTLRIALANIESDLASELAITLARPREAKKTLANLFAAPGTIQLTARTINVALAPAATARERDSFRVLLQSVNSQKLTLPGDPSRRRLRFSLQE
jgi:hypothetical protein